MILDLSPPFDNTHPADIDVFSDWYSLVHVGLGYIAGQMEAPTSLALLVLYEGYQLAQEGTGESAGRTGGELIEFSIGLVLAGLVKRRNKWKSY